MLAYHFARAEDWARALDYLLKAAEKATKAFGLRQALDLYGEALETARRLGEGVPATTVMAIHRARADLFFGIGAFDRSRTEAEALVELTRRVQDRPAEAGALVQVASALQWIEDFPPALERAREAIEIAESSGAQAALGGALYVRGYVHLVSGGLEVAEEELARALASARAGDAPGLQALVMHTLALRRSWQGEYQESLKVAREAVQIAREHRLVVPLIRGLWNIGVAWTDLGDYDKAIAALRVWLLPRKSGTRLSSRASGTRSDGSGSIAGTSRRASSYPSGRTRKRIAPRRPDTAPAPSAAPSSASTRRTRGRRRGTSRARRMPWRRRGSTPSTTRRLPAG
jgi:tetratricopeptide (TPR) repeat protein